MNGFKHLVCRAMVLAIALAGAGGTIAAAPAAEPAVAVVDAGPGSSGRHEAFLLHLPGIDGTRGVDHSLIAGLADAGLRAEVHIDDWTEQAPGLSALMAYDRNLKEAQAAADLINRRFEQDPASPIVVTAHSGGTAIAVWALERLRPGVMVRDVVLLAPALSPHYDLTAALRHVQNAMTVYSSPIDGLVLGIGTSLFGTMDRVNGESAGRYGFEVPASADFNVYQQKLRPAPYRREWAAYGDKGSHIGPMSRAFASHIVAPSLIKDCAAPPAGAVLP